MVSPRREIQHVFGQNRVERERPSAETIFAVERQEHVAKRHREG
jgi:hypothetical protein